MALAKADILIVDDNPANLDLLGRILRQRGYKVRALPSGSLALDAARMSPPDLMMLDITMPGMDGYETCRAFKSESALASIPIIFISALDDAVDKVKAFGAGGADYVPKPFQAEEVLARVEHHLRLRDLQKELESRNRNLEEANQKLMELDQMKEGFTAMLVHDLKTPLTLMGLAMDLYREEGSIPEKTMDHCKRGLNQVLELLGDLLDVFRSDAQVIPLELETVAPGPFIAAITEGFIPLARQRKIELKVEAPDALPEFRADPRKLERVLSNLLSNAFKFTGEGGTISFCAGVQKGHGVDQGLSWIAFQVTDNGRGIPAAQLPYIFDPYRQASAADCKVGTGLGLAIVQRLVAAHGGRVQVQSQVGVGTTFLVEIPMSPNPESAAL